MDMFQVLMVVWFGVICYMVVFKTELFLKSYQGDPEVRKLELQLESEREAEARQHRTTAINAFVAWWLGRK